MLAIVPFKGLDGAKTRLAAVLPPEERARLALEMLERVLVACEGASSIRRTLLVTPDPSARRSGVDVLVDAGTGHAAAVALALADPRAQERRGRGHGRLPARGAGIASTPWWRRLGRSPSSLPGTGA